MQTSLYSMEIGRLNSKAFAIPIVMAPSLYLKL